MIQPATFILQYPTVAVHGTPENWLLHSQIVTMASNHDDGWCEDTSSSLGDGSYDFIDDRSIVTSDDEESQSAMAQSMSSDEHDIDRNDSHQPDPSIPSNNIRDNQSSTPQSRSVFAHREHSLQSESQLTTRDIDLESGTVVEAGPSHSKSLGQVDEKQSYLRLTESTPIDPKKPIEGLHTIRVFTGPHVSRVFHDIHSGNLPGEVTVKVKQTMVSEGLSLEEPYKVLYIGDTIVKDSIIQKVGAALAATVRLGEARPSKFNVVPIFSFGDTASPEVVLIDSSGLELSVDECTSATFVRRDEGNDTIRMTLSDGVLIESSWSGSQFSVSNHWKLPDVAIFYLSAKDTILAKQTERFARSFMLRHDVPAILISDIPLWTSGTWTHIVDPRTPHLLIESYSPTAGRYRTINHLPIDLSTFLHLDACQLNRNLAFLALAKRSSTIGRTKDLVSKVDNAEAEASISNRRQFARVFDRVRGLLPRALIILLPMLLFHLVTSNTSRQHQSLEPIVNTGIPTQAAVTPKITSLPTPIVAVRPRDQPSVVSHTVSSPEPVHIAKSISAVYGNTDMTSYLASFLAETYTLSPNSSDKFMVHVIGDRHIVIRPPYWFTRSRKAPKLLFNVTREGSLLEHEVSPLFDGVYALKLHHADAYGVLNISTWTVSKPKIHETFQVILKTSWLKMHCWKKAANGMINLFRGDGDFLQDSLANTRNLTGRALETLMHDAHENAIMCTNQASKLMRAPRSLLEKLQVRRTTAPEAISRHVQRLRKALALHASCQRSQITQRAGRISQHIEALVHDFEKIREEHLRKTQKGALKTWWKITGLPEQKIVSEAKSGVQKHTARFKKRSRR